MSQTSTNLPPLIYGTAWKKERTEELVVKAIQYGFRGIDTACQPKHYNEAGVGQALKRLNVQGISRSAIFLQTKYTPYPGQDPANVPYDPNSPIAEQVRQSFQKSLENLGVDYIDAVLLHSPLSQHAHTMEAWRELEQLHQKGSLHLLGVSNCYDLETFKLIYGKATIKPSLLQNRFYAETDYDKDLRQWCSEKNVRYQSFWTLTANPHILSHPLLLTLATTYDVTVAQIFFRFLTQKKIIPLTGTCSEKHMQEDLAIFDFTLTDDQIKQITHCCEKR